MTSPQLLLHEELMLLALKDREGTLAVDTTVPYAIGGAVLAELLVSERIDVERRGRKTLVEVRDTTPLHDEVIDEWLTTMAAAKKPKTLNDWVARIARGKDLHHRVATQLCRRGILRNDEDKVLWIFTRKIYPELDPTPERHLIARLDAAIFRDHAVDSRTAVLVAIADAAGILKVVFDKARLKKRKDRIQRIGDGVVAADATKAAIEAMHAAIAIAVMIPTVTATVT